MKQLKFIVTGHGDHGKDTVCEMLKEYGYTFSASSAICNEHVIFPILTNLFSYQTLEECFEDRRNHRELWKRLIADYNYPDKAGLCKKIFIELGNNIYCGLREVEEYIEARKQGIVDLVIWVDARKRKPPEPETSITIEPVHAHYIVDNNGTKEDLVIEVKKLVNFLNQFE
jgi:dephospho-CoA kinase